MDILNKNSLMEETNSLQDTENIQNIPMPELEEGKDIYITESTLQGLLRNKKSRYGFENPDFIINGMDSVWNEVNLREKYDIDIIYNDEIIDTITDVKRYVLNPAGYQFAQRFIADGWVYSICRDSVKRLDELGEGWTQISNGDIGTRKTGDWKFIIGIKNDALYSVSISSKGLLNEDVVTSVDLIDNTRKWKTVSGLDSTATATTTYFGFCTDKNDNLFRVEFSYDNPEEVNVIDMNITGCTQICYGGENAPTYTSYSFFLKDGDLYKIAHSDFTVSLIPDISNVTQLVQTNGITAGVLIGKDLVMLNSGGDIQVPVDRQTDSGLPQASHSSNMILSNNNLYGFNSTTGVTTLIDIPDMNDNIIACSGGFNVLSTGTSYLNISLGLLINGQGELYSILKEDESSFYVRRIGTKSGYTSVAFCQDTYSSGKGYCLAIKKY